MPPVPISALLDAIAGLHQRLDQLTNSSPQDVAQERAQIMMVLRAFVEFLRPQRGENDPISRILFNASAALLDLDDGVVADLLRPADLGPGRRRDATGIWLDRATVCIAFTLLCRVDGVTQDAAAHHIRSDHGWIDGLVGPRSDGASTTAAIKRWEWTLRNPTKNVQMAADVYRHGIEMFDLAAASISPPVDLRAYANALLAAHRERRAGIS
jgi:hypothetical protein